MFGIGENKSEAKLRAYAYRNGAFNDRKSAFDYFFIVEGKSIEEAERLSGILANARGIPDQSPAPENIADKAKKVIGQCTQLASEHPRIAEFFIGLVSGAAASLTGVAVGNNIAQQNEEPKHDIDNNSEAKEI